MDESNVKTQFGVQNPKMFPLIGLFLIVHSIMPYYNKSLFVIYNFPVTSTWLQCVGVTIFLCLWDTVRHFRPKSKAASVLLSESQTRSWVFGPGFWFKMKHMILPGFCFAIFLTLNNVGLSLVNVLLHLMLKASQTAFTVLFTILFLPEKPTYMAMSVAFLSALGGFCLSMAALEGGIDEWALVINILNAMMSPLSVITLRNAVYTLKYGDIQENPYGEMSIIEMTAFKMGLVCVFMLPILLVKETALSDTTAWEGLIQGFGASCIANFLLLGFVFTLLNQSLVVALCYYMEPVAKTVLSDASNIPQLSIAFLVGGWTLKVCGCTALSKCHHVDYPNCPCFKDPLDKFTSSYEELHILGFVLIICTSISFSILKYKKWTVKAGQANAMRLN